MTALETQIQQVADRVGLIGNRHHSDVLMVINFVVDDTQRLALLLA